MLTRGAHEPVDLAARGSANYKHMLEVWLDTLRDTLRQWLIARLMAMGTTFEHGAVAEVDPDARSVALTDGQRFPYDKLVLATGTDPHAAAHGMDLFACDDVGLNGHA